MNPQQFAQDFKNCAKVAKFRQIWSHCQGAILLCQYFDFYNNEHLPNSFKKIPYVGSKF